MDFEVTVRFNVTAQVTDLKAEALGTFVIADDAGERYEHTAVSDPTDALALLVSARFNGAIPHLFESLEMKGGVVPQIRAIEA